MLHAAAVLVISLVLAPAAAASTRPPTLPLLPTEAATGSIAQFPCPMHPQTTLEIEACSARSVLSLDRRIDALMKTIWSRLRDRTGRAGFAAAELAWQRYVGEECTSVSGAYSAPSSPHAYVGGSSAAVEYALCELRLGASHLRELTKAAADLAPR
jgi:uncharacterized protein YecT (DUF1311 family)